MPGLINLGAGLSALGNSVAESAQSAGLLAQKAELERAQAELTNSLIAGRESAGRAQEHGYRTQEQNARMDFDTKRDAQNHEQRMGEIEEGHKFRLNEISQESKNRIAAAAAAHGLEAGDISYVETDASGNKFGITRAGKKVDLGIAGTNAEDEKLLGRAEKFAMTRRTVVDPDTGQKTTEDTLDPQKAADFLNRQGRKDLAAGYAKPAKAVAPAMPRGLPNGSQYSPSRNMWRDPDGKLYDSTGKPVGNSSNAGMINMPAPGL